MVTSCNVIDALSEMTVHFLLWRFVKVYVSDCILCVDKMEKESAGTYDIVFMDIQMPNSASMNGHIAKPIEISKFLNVLAEVL